MSFAGIIDGLQFLLTHVPSACFLRQSEFFRVQEGIEAFKNSFYDISDFGCRNAVSQQAIVKYPNLSRVLLMTNYVL